METKHTKGEWYVRFFSGKDDGESDFFVESENLGSIGKVEILQDDYGVHNGYPRFQRLADAKLIAAAPDLLRELVQYIEFKDRQHGRQLDSFYYSFKSAIKKATT